MAQVIRSSKDLGRAIRAQRTTLGYTQAQVAALCNTGVRFISDIENGKETAECGKVLLVANSLGIDLVAQVRGQV